MSFTVPKSYFLKPLVALFVAWGSSAIAGSQQEPRIIQEPILGLRYEPAKVKFHRLPPEEFAKCGELVGDDEKWSSHFWIFALAQEAGRTHYVVGGYYSRRYPVAGEPSIELDEPGIAFSIEGKQCEVFGQARELFKLHEDTPAPLLRRLANDAAVRLVRGFGGPERLMAEVKNQRIDQDQLPLYLREAFQSYFPSATNSRR